MKLVMAIVSNDDSSNVLGKLMEGGYAVTRLATTGGFLSKGNTTLLMGTDDDKVDGAIAIIEETCKRRTSLTPSSAAFGVGVGASYPMEIAAGGATVFVMGVERFEKI